MSRKRRENFAAAGPIRVRWHKLADGRTVVDPRRYGRKQEAFHDAAEAKRRARALALEIFGGGTEATALTAEDRSAFSHARAETRKHGMDLLPAVMEWSDARRRIHGSRHDLGAVISAGLASLERRPHPVRDVAAEFIASKKTGADLDLRYVRGLESTWNLLARTFQDADIRTITVDQISTLLDGKIDDEGKRVGGLRKYGRSDAELIGTRRRDNVLDEIRQGFQFARIRGYLPDEVSAPQKVAMRHKLGAPISFFTVVEMRLILEHVAEEWLPFIVLACFAGIRTGELALSKDAKRSKDPLRWEDFDFEEREIHVRAETAKIEKPRIVPILDNAYEWLLPYRKERGRVAPSSRPDREFGKGGRLEQAINAALQEAPRLRNDQPVQLQMEEIDPSPVPLLTEFAWRNNALRHSYGSYRATILRNLHQLADEMGNSPAICARHYRNPRPKAQARAWFEIRPIARPVVIEFPRQAVG